MTAAAIPTAKRFGIIAADQRCKIRFTPWCEARKLFAIS
jgi:hypothetical protein